MSSSILSAGVFKFFDLIIEFAKNKEESRRRRFDNIAVPLFTDLQPVVDSYFSFYNDLHNKLQTGTDEEFVAVINELKLAYDPLLASRVQVRQLAVALYDMGIEDYAKFADAIMRFFYASAVQEGELTRDDVSKQSRTIQLLEELVFKEEIPRDRLLVYFERITSKLEKYWLEISKQYAQLRIASYR